MVLEEQELSLDQSLKQAFSLINYQKGPIQSLHRNPRYNDEPLLYQYTAVVKKTSDLSDAGYNSNELTGGMDFCKKKAAMKALGEAIERYCLSIYHWQGLKYASAREMRNKALDLNSVVAFSRIQLKKGQFKDFRFNQNTKFWWKSGYSLTKAKPVYIPAQLIYLPYCTKNEGYIRLPISTGAASGSSLGAAIMRGICEVIERDAFMIFYLNKLTPQLININLSQNKLLSKIVHAFNRYGLELYVFNITTDIQVSSIMAIIVDRSGMGPSISVGLKSSLNPELAISGAIEEAEHTRPWIRDAMLKLRAGSKLDDNGDISLIERGLFWSGLDKIDRIDFFLKSRKFIQVEDFIKNMKVITPKDLRSLLLQLKQLDLEVVFVDVTRDEVRKIGFYVVKVVIPRLQPLYLSEDFKYHGGERLLQVPVNLGYRKNSIMESELNGFPHPFL